MVSKGKRIGYILSMKEGLPSFNYREMELVEDMGYEIHVLPTKTSKGLYNPKESWTVCKPNVGAAFASTLYWLIARPLTFTKATWTAFGEKALPELALASQFSRHIIRNKIRTIHCHFADRKMFTAYFCNLLTGVPYTVTVHSHELAFYSDRKLFHLALEKCGKVVAICEFNRSFLIERCHLSPDKVVTIRLSAPLNEFRNDPRLKILTVAKLYEYKGLDVLVETIRRLKPEQAVFWLVGDGPVDVRAMARDLIEEGRLRMFGQVDEQVLKVLYASCDIFCLPSKQSSSGQKEGLPVSIMEAMAFSKPVVSTNHAGIPELVESIIVQEGDADGLARALEHYLESCEARTRDGERNRKTVERLHGPDNVRRLAELFEHTV